jgi:hypothetical protein
MSGESAYLTELADTIGPRPATTDAEARAAEWVTEVFTAKGLEVSRQEIDTPRTTSWGPLVTYVLTILAACAATPLFPLALVPALVVALVAAVLLTLDLTGRFRMASIMPKGPSQNIIAKHCPHARRNERMRKVVIVANIDSARPSLVTNGGLVRSQTVIVRITLCVSWLVVLLVAAGILPWTKAWEPWLWYVGIVASLWLLFPMVVVLQKELAGTPSDGANADASGIAAMLGIVDRLIPEAAEARPSAAPAQPVRQGADVVWAADLVPGEADLRYSGATAPPARERSRGVDASDVGSWAEVGATADEEQLGGLDAENIPRRRRGAFDTGEVPVAGATRGEPVLPFDDDLIDNAFADSGAIPRVSRSSEPSTDVPADVAQGAPPARPIADVDVSALVETPPAPPADDRDGKPGKKDKGAQEGGVFGWLGVDTGWDARKKGREIGSWEKFDDEEEDHEAGWKGGEVGDEEFDRGGSYGPTGLPDAGGTGSLWESLDRLPTNRADASHVDEAPARPPAPAPRASQPTQHPSPRAEHESLTGHLSDLAISDPGFATDEIARIRRKVTQGVDRELSEKEIWFVATGAGEVDGWGMRELLKEHGEELRDAYFIGLYCVGTGALTYVTDEGGPIGKVSADRRLVTAAKRVARDKDVPMTGGVSRWCETDVYVARRKKHKAMSLMAFDINGRLGEWRSVEDTVAQVSADNLAVAADFVTALIREL